MLIKGMRVKGIRIRKTGGGGKRVDSLTLLTMLTMLTRLTRLTEG
jgi:hypothetical protein